VSGKVIPLKLNPVLGVIWEIVRDVPPEFVSFSASVVLLPVVTFPKLRVVGLAANCPGRVPVPVDGTLRLGFDPLELMMRLPVTFPVVCGANDAVKVTL
jgi:hypothetical protein